MAARLMKEQNSAAERIDTAFKAIYGRVPAPSEQEKCLAHLARMTQQHSQKSPQPTNLPTKIQRGMVEELTGEMVYWERSSILKITSVT
jgi:hypothetical protein